MSMMMGAIIKKKTQLLTWEYLKTWVGIFQVAVFWVGIFQGGIYQGGVRLVEIFRVGIFLVGVFLVLKKIYAKNSQVHMHWHWSSSEKSSYSKPKATVLSPPTIVTFCYGTEIFPHTLVQLTGRISALIGYTEMKISFSERQHEKLR